MYISAGFIGGEYPSGKRVRKEQKDIQGKKELVGGIPPSQCHAIHIDVGIYIIYEKEVLQDIKRIKKYCTPLYYDKIILDISKTIDMIKIFPKIAKTLYFIKDIDGDYRRVISGKYIIIYKIEKENIEILRIFNARENYLNKKMFMVKEKSCKYRYVS